MTDFKQIAAVLALIFVTAVWGLTFIYVKWTIAEMDLYYFMFLRFLIASGLMALIFFKQLKKISWGAIKSGIVLGIFFTGAYVSQTEGLRFTSAANSAMITGLYMVLIPVCLFFFKGERPHWFSIVGIVLSFTGLYLLTQKGVQGPNVGDLITLLTAISCALHLILTGKYTKKHSVVPLVVVQFTFAACVCGAMMFIRKTSFTVIPAVGCFTIFLTAVFATCVAFMVQTYVQRIIEPTRVAVILALEAAFGALFGVVIGNEKMTELALIGACLMFLGMIISEIRPLVKKLVYKVAG